MPIRLLHFADLHLGVETHGQYRPDIGLSSRVHDFLAAFDQVIEAALSETVDAVLFAGDAFKNAEPNPTLQRHFAARIQRLIAAGIPTVLLVGNHDRPRSFARSTPIDIYAALELPGVIVSGRPDLYRIATKSGLLQVVTLPWLPMRQILADDALREAGTTEAERRFKELIGELMQSLLRQLDPSYPAVFLGHLSMEGGRFGSERSALLGNDPLFSLEELGLDTAPVDYVALGHLHSHQVLHHRPPVVYAGSVERVDFGEEREEKGFVLVTLHEGPFPRPPAQWHFQPLRTRPLRTIRLEVSSEQPMDEIRRALERRQDQLREAIVRVFLALPPDRAADVRPVEIRRWLVELGAWHVAGIEVETERPRRPRVDVAPESRHDPVLLLQRWVRLRQLPPDFAQAVVERGRRLVAEVEAGTTSLDSDDQR